MECLTSLSLEEDDVSIVTNMRTIAEHGFLTNGKRNLVTINVAMSQTFPERRKAILVDLVKINWLNTSWARMEDVNPVASEMDGIELQFGIVLEELFLYINI